MSRRPLVLLAAAAALGCGPRRAPGGDRAGDPPEPDAAIARAAPTPRGPSDAALAETNEPEQVRRTEELAPPPASYGSIAGTAFWLGPPPTVRDGRRIQLMDGRPGDWEGDEDAEHYCLEDVIVTAIPAAGVPASVRTSSNWPSGDSLSCTALHCPPYVTLSASDLLELRNYRRTPVVWQLRRDGRVRQTIELAAGRIDPPAMLDVSELEPGAYEIVDASGARSGWLYRAATGELVVGATRGNCRYSISVAPGAYRVVAWHPDLAPIEKPVEVRPARTRRVNAVFAPRDLRDR